MFGWREERQFLFGAIAVIIFSLLIAGFYIHFHTPPSCQNNKKDTTELGVDCGGSCTAVCALETRPLSVVWAKAFPLGDNRYDLAALVDNPNPLFGVPSLAYTFEVRNAKNEVIFTRTGNTFANPNERFLAFESNVNLPEIPRQVFISFSPVSFVRFTETPAPLLVSRRNENLQLSPVPKFSLLLTNQEPTALTNLEVRTVISNTEDNAVAVSSTEVERIERDASRDVFFTWPSAFSEKPQVCTEPIDAMLLFDRSGSMDDDGQNPPQPLTEAKHAAQTFLNSFGKNDQVGLISFATNASKIPDQELTGILSLSREALSRVSILPSDQTGSTNMAEALSAARGEFNTPRHREKAKSVLVLFTDGKANYPSGKGETLAKKEALAARQEGIIVYTIGLGRAVNSAFLKELAGSSGKYYQAATTNDLVGIYEDVSRAICPDRTYIRTVYIRKNYAETRSD